MKTHELIGPALDWAVAKCEGVTEKWRQDGPFLWDGVPCIREFGHDFRYSPSTDWSHAGPIIEREDISFRKYNNTESEKHGTYYARICRESGKLVGWYKTTGHQHTGPTPLIAAMRAYVASKLGYEIEIPEELCANDAPTQATT